MKCCDLLSFFNCAIYVGNVTSDPHNNSAGSQHASDPAGHQALSFAPGSQKTGISSVSLVYQYS